jgi:hypothetical protein
MVQKYKKSLIIRTIIRKSLEVWKNVLIFAAIKCNILKIKWNIDYKYHYTEY